MFTTIFSKGLAALTTVVAVTTGGLVLGATPAFAGGTGRVVAAPCLNLRSGPNSFSPLVGCVPNQTVVAIDCVSSGTPVTGPFGRETLWDHTVYNGVSGFASDAWIYTGTSQAVAPSCGAAAPAPSSPPSSASGRATGRKTDRNLGYAGQCTFGALEDWHAATGYYPFWSGDARYWAASARANGWTVVPDAQVRSIVVFQPYVQGASSVGHVAWVTGVSRHADGLYVTFHEMNGTRGPGRSDTRTVKDVAGMSYILAP